MIFSFTNDTKFFVLTSSNVNIFRRDAKRMSAISASAIADLLKFENKSNEPAIPKME